MLNLLMECNNANKVSFLKKISKTLQMNGTRVSDMIMVRLELVIPSFKKGKEGNYVFQRLMGRK